LKVYGQLERAQAELLAADPTGTGLINGRFWYDTVANNLRFYNGAVRVIVSQNDTQTLTNKTLTGNIMGNLSPDGVETITFPAATDTVALLAEAQTLTNKALPTILFPHQTTPSNPAAGNALLYVKADRKAYLLDEEGNEQQIGSGGGGLDVFLIEDFQTNNAADASTGNNAAFLGGGVLNGTLADETGAPIAGTRSLKYTMGAASTNDYFAMPAHTLESKQKGQYVGITGYYTYDGDAGDIQLVLYNVQDSSILTSDLDTFETEGGNTRYSTSVFIPSAATDIRLGAFVKVGNSGKILVLDELEVSTNPFVYKDLVEFSTIRLQDLTTDVRGSGNEAATVQYDDVLEVTGNGLSVNNTNGSLITILKDGLFSINCQGQIGGTATITKNATTPTIGLPAQLEVYAQHGLSGVADLSATFPVVVGDIIRVQTNVAGASGTRPSLTCSLLSKASHVTSPASDTANSFSARIANSGSATITSQGRKNAAGEDAIASVNRDSAGVVTVTFTAGFFTVAPKVIIDCEASGRLGTPTSITTSGFVANTEIAGSSSEDRPFGVTIDRQGTDVKSALLEAQVPIPKTIIFTDKKANNTHGGTFTTGDWRTRVLNDVEGDSEIGTLSANQFTLEAGEYSYDFHAPACRVTYHSARLRNITDGVTVGEASAIYSNASPGSTTLSVGRGKFTITKQTTFEIQHRCDATVASVGFGFAVGFTVDNEVYTQGKFTKLR